MIYWYMYVLKNNYNDTIPRSHFAQGKAKAQMEGDRLAFGFKFQTPHALSEFLEKL